jgi:hypothetical protein
MAVHIATAAMVAPAVGWEIRQQMNSQD